MRKAPLSLKSSHDTITPQGGERGLGSRLPTCGRGCRHWVLLCSLSTLALRNFVLAQYSYVTNGDGLTITGYSGPAVDLVIPDTINGLPVTGIEHHAFYGLSNLTRMTFPTNLRSIGEMAFCRSGLISLTIPNRVVGIGDSAFSFCERLTSVTIPQNVADLGNGPFRGCPNLSAIKVDGDNTSYQSVDGVLFNKELTTLIQFPGGGGGDYAVPGRLTGIGDFALYGCARLTSVIIPDSVTNLGSLVFYSCTSLTNLILPVGLTNIPYGAFWGCSGLGSAPLPDSVNRIGPYAFLQCTGLTSVTIPNGVTSIEDAVFAGCTNLGRLSIPASVTNISQDTFRGCTSLTSVTLPSGLTYLGPGAFSYCANLAAIYFTGNRPSISRWPESELPFAGCPLVTIYYLPGTQDWDFPAVLWNPQARSPGDVAGHFGFEITGPTNGTIVVEACTNLVVPLWLPVSTNTFNTAGLSFFGDPESSEQHTRFYRFRSP